MDDNPKLDALRALEAEDKLDGENLLSVAADPAHPCHPDFDWDDAAAAHRYRLGQANKMIVRYRIVTADRDGVECAARVFTYVPSQGRHVDGDRAIVDHRDELEDIAKRDARHFVTKHRRLGADKLQALVGQVLDSQ